jgi:hypothetical protein
MKSLNREKGIASSVGLIIMGVLVVALPVSTKLVQRSQENRSSAAGVGQYGESCVSNSDCKSGYCTIGSNFLRKVCSVRSSDKACNSLGGTCNASYTKGKDNTGEVCITDKGLEGTVFLNLCLSSESSVFRCCVPVNNNYGEPPAPDPITIGIDGVCGKKPNSCEKGIFKPSDNVVGLHTYTWRCEGIDGGKSITCRANKDKTPVPDPITIGVDGVCGKKPKSCEKGLVELLNLIPEEDTYLWRCEGIDGGEDAVCKVEKGKVTDRVDAICGPAVDEILTSFPSYDEERCEKGIFNGFIGDDGNSINKPEDPYYLWGCDGINGGENVECKAKKQKYGDSYLTPIPDPNPITIGIDGVCGEKPNSCEKGIFKFSNFITRVFNPSYYRWSCEGIDGGKSVTCKANKKRESNDSDCGSADRESFTSRPVDNLCVKGSNLYWKDEDAGDGKWDWLCQRDGGFNSYCSAYKKPEKEREGNLSFKFSLSGIKGDARCTTDIINHLDGIKVYMLATDVSEELTIDEGSISAFEGDINKFGDQIFKVSNLNFDVYKFGEAITSAIRIKTGSHLQRRYCVDGQDSRKLSGCGIKLGVDYDFSNYPMIAGDLTGSSGRPDGAIDILDQSYIESKLENFDPNIKCGKKGDLNADGIINSLDLQLIKQGREKYSE